jgi:hypothetical protein
LPHFKYDPLKSISTPLFNALKKSNPGSAERLSNTIISIANRWFMNKIDGTVTLLLDNGVDVDCCWLD